MNRIKEKHIPKVEETIESQAVEQVEGQGEEQERKVELCNQNKETWINKLREFAYKTEVLPKNLKNQFIIAKKNILKLFGKIAGKSSKTNEKIQKDKNER